MENNKPRQILYRTHYKNHKKVFLSVSQALTTVLANRPQVTEEQPANHICRWPRVAQQSQSLTR